MPYSDLIMTLTRLLSAILYDTFLLINIPSDGSCILPDVLCLNKNPNWTIREGETLKMTFLCVIMCDLY